MRLAYNPLDVPFVDSGGRITGGREWRALDPKDPLVAGAIDDGRLVWSQPPGEDAQPQAQAAHAEIGASEQTRKSRRGGNQEE
jgi:hypothetical protein